MSYVTEVTVILTDWRQRHLFEGLVEQHAGFRPEPAETRGPNCISIQQNRNDGLCRWFCERCEPRYEQWGPWGRPTSEHMDAMRAAERQHLWDWHTPQVLKDAWGPPESW